MARSIQVTLKSDPFIDDPPRAGELYEAVGRYIRVWSHLEDHFSSVLISMLHHRMVVPLMDQLKLDKEGPVSFKRKLKLWRRLWCNVPAFVKFSDAALEFATAIGNANDDRNTLLHNAWQEFTDENALAVRSSSWLLRERKLTTRRVSFNLAQVQEMMADADALNTRLLSFMFLVIKTGQPLLPSEAVKPYPPKQPP
jgi:hypothetical protein